MNSHQNKINILLICICLFFSSLSVEAHPHDSEHNAELEKVLFEEGYSKYQSNEIKNDIKALEYASYLTIDQFGGKGEDKFNELKRMKVGRLPWRFSSIDYDYVIGDPERKISPNTHRKYTHEGWDRDYSSKSYDVQEFWGDRRKVLLGTVNSVFKFDTITIFGYSEKCNSMAGIIYYVHILGDYDEADTYTKINLLPDLAGRDNANDKDKDYDMITSLKSYIEILFADQKKSTEYKKLMDGLDDISDGAGKIVKSTGHCNTDEEFVEYHQYSQEIMILLQEYMPTLLKNEDFFAEKFYPDKTK